MDYEYLREQLPSGKWDIDHPERIDANGLKLRLAKEVEESLPGKMFSLHCKSNEAIFAFEEDLIEAEEDILDGIVADHKANVVTAEMLLALKINRVRECAIDANVYIDERGYDINRRMSFQNRLWAADKDGLTDRKTYIEQLPEWIFGEGNVIEYYRTKRAEILTCGTSEAIKAVTWDFSQFDISDPNISVDGALDIPT